MTLKNINAKGWDIGLKVEHGSQWLVENCDFSDNFHYPEAGWGELGHHGGIVLEFVDHSTLRKNKANRVWDACMLANSNDNLVEENDFSHTSNTCLSLWTACRNRVLKNNLSWGIRIKPGEVHARDSACVLVQAGSDDNYFADNDITHGGDGVFLRPFAGWTSSGNVFERNDASYANNNCFEAQCPRNTYRHNKANHGSHGIWVGWSNETIVEDNEACYNGLPSGIHNAPWRFKYVPNGPQNGRRRHHHGRHVATIRSAAATSASATTAPASASSATTRRSTSSRPSTGSWRTTSSATIAGESTWSSPTGSTWPATSWRTTATATSSRGARTRTSSCIPTIRKITQPPEVKLVGADAGEAGPAGARQAGPAGRAGRLGQHRPRRQSARPSAGTSTTGRPPPGPA